MSERFLLCTDLDRTLLPNGLQPESPGARECFAWLAQQEGVSIAYSTGRDRRLILEAIRKFRIPIPDYVLGDVGTSIFSIDDGEWQSWKDWQERIASDWRGYSRQEIAHMLQGHDALRLQEESKQNLCKLSYYVDDSARYQQQKPSLQAILEEYGIRANIIYSEDETRRLGLLDILPASASKQHALEFLMQKADFTTQHTVFAGDSGNDLPVLCSPIQAVLVANATGEVRRQALDEAARRDTRDALYLAQGGYLGMNGNYAAGILEGVAHYLPQLRQRLQTWGEQHG